MRTKCAVILFGPPGSGKTTVVRSMTSHQQMAVIETGNLLERHGIELCAVLVLTLNYETAVHRLAGRSVCPACRSLYNLHSNPPRSAGNCDRCGNELIQRLDDREEIVRHRFETYQRETLPVIEFFKREHPTLCVEELATAPMNEIGNRLNERLEKDKNERASQSADG